MSDTKLNKEVFETHMLYIRESIADIKKDHITIFKKLDQHESTLVKNTEILDQHHRRSTNLEARQDEFLTTLRQMVDKISILSERVHSLENDLEPVKDKIKGMEGLIQLFTAIYNNKGLLIKVVFFSVVVFFGIFSLSQKINIMELIR